MVGNSFSSTVIFSFLVRSYHLCGPFPWGVFHTFQKSYELRNSLRRIYWWVFVSEARLLVLWSFISIFLNVKVESKRYQIIAFKDTCLLLWQVGADEPSMCHWWRAGTESMFRLVSRSRYVSVTRSCSSTTYSTLSNTGRPSLRRKGKWFQSYL